MLKKSWHTGLVGVALVVSAISATSLYQYSHRDINPVSQNAYDDVFFTFNQQQRVFDERLRTNGWFTARPSLEQIESVMARQHVLFTANKEHPDLLLGWAQMLHQYEHHYKKQIDENKNALDALSFWKKEVQDIFPESVKAVLAKKAPTSNIEAIDGSRQINALCEVLEYVNPKAKDIAKSLGLKGEDWLKVSYKVTDGYEDLLETPTTCFAVETRPVW